jgi:carboxypeptidase Q
MGLLSLKPWMGIVCGALVMHATNAAAQQDAPASLLIKEIAERSELMPNLQELCDGIGPRMTGSAQLRTAQAWAMEKLKGYGAVNVHLEAYDLGRPWQRGIARARLLNASGIALDIVQQAWTTGTGGVLKADVAALDVKTLDEFKAAAPALKGKIVLVVSAPKASRELDEAIRAAHFAAVLFVSGRDGNLLDMWGGPPSRLQRSAAIVSKDNASLLRRLLAKGVVPKLELELTGGFGSKPVQAYNVVADLPGSDGGGEMVIVGAHQDSWDLGSGATDNGSGTVIMMEVLRAMHASGLKPKRRLRVVLFSGEEQGLLGSKAYVAAHQAELANVQAVLVQDAGAGRITGFPDMKVEAWYAALSSAMAPARQLGDLDVVYAVSRGTDHATFFDQGLPAFAAMQDLLDYRSHTQHSQVDSIDHVKPADLVQGAQVMAVTAWGLLNGERLPHQPRQQTGAARPTPTRIHKVRPPRLVGLQTSPCHRARLV